MLVGTAVAFSSSFNQSVHRFLERHEELERMRKSPVEPAGPVFCGLSIHRWMKLRLRQLVEEGIITKRCTPVIEFEVVLFAFGIHLLLSKSLIHLLLRLILDELWDIAALNQRVIVDAFVAVLVSAINALVSGRVEKLIRLLLAHRLHVKVHSARLVAVAIHTGCRLAGIALDD